MIPISGIERIAIFIDGSNLYHILKNLFSDSKSVNEFDFEEFVKLIAAGRKLIRTYYYIAPLDRKRSEDKYRKQQKFFEKLKKIPDFELILCRMQKEIIGGKVVYTVKEDDIHIAVDMLELAYNNAYDTAILVSSDSDFVPAIEKVKKVGKTIENIGFENKFSWHLKQKSDRFAQLNKNDLEKCFKKQIIEDGY